MTPCLLYPPSSFSQSANYAISKKGRQAIHVVFEVRKALACVTLVTGVTLHDGREHVLAKENVSAALLSAVAASRKKTPGALARGEDWRIAFFGGYPLILLLSLLTVQVGDLPGWTRIAVRVRTTPCLLTESCMISRR